MPTYTIAANAGVEGAVVVGKLLEQNNLDIGYDAARGMLPVLHVILHMYFNVHAKMLVWDFIVETGKHVARGQKT